MSKIFLDHKELAAVLETARSSGGGTIGISSNQNRSRIVFTNGCFDLLHVGHIRYLQEARSLGDKLVVALNSDASAQKLKGPTRPVQQELDRVEIMAALACVDYVTLFGEQTPLEIIEMLKPDILVKGGDWTPDKIVGSDFVIKNGGQVKSLAFQPGRSTSSIIEKIKI